MIPFCTRGHEQADETRTHRSGTKPEFAISFRLRQKKGLTPDTVMVAYNGGKDAKIVVGLVRTLELVEEK